jgi:hypothetical protein
LATDGWRHINEDLWFIAWVGVIGAACGVIVLYPVPRFIGRIIWSFIRKLFTRRFWKWALIILACITALIALFYTEEDLRGKWAWENYKRTWEAKGEKFDLVSLAPPPVPDDQNFAMTPLLKPILDYESVSMPTLSDPEREDHFRWRDTNGYDRAQSINAYLNNSEVHTNELVLASLEQGTFTDLESVRAFYRGNTNYPQPTESKSPAEDILVALGKFHVEFKELQEASATRPYSRFPVEYDYKIPSSIILPHLVVVKRISVCAELRAIAQLEMGHNKEAFTNLQLGFRLADSIQQEPILISHLVRIAFFHIELQAVREGLMRHAWSDAQLAKFEDYFGSTDLLTEYSRAMRGERAMNIGDVEFIRRRKWRFNQPVFFSGSNWEDFIFRFSPSGWYRQNMLALSRLHENYTLAAVDAKAHRVFPEIIERGREIFFGRFHIGPYNILAQMLFPAAPSAVAKAARGQTYLDAAHIACALERYRLANGKFPETLDALTPKFLNKIPNDVIDGQPLRYHLKPDGNYVIYSIGWNKTDDGGERGWSPIEYTGEKHRLDFDKGDWVWSSSAP